MPEDISMTVKGRDAKTGLPRQIELFSSEIFEVLRRPARQITDEVLHVLEETSPELVGDIAINGITLTGGGSQIWGTGVEKSNEYGTVAGGHVEIRRDVCFVLGRS